MSIGMMNAVWRRARYDAGELLVLLALADWSDDEGRCFPGIAQIATKSRLTERQVYRVLGKLKADGVLTVEAGGGRGVRSQYRIIPDMLSGFAAPAKPGNPARNTDTESGFATGENPDTTEPETGPKTLTSAPQNPDICDKSPRPPNRKNHQLTTNTNNTPLPPSQASGERGEAVSEIESVADAAMSDPADAALSGLGDDGPPPSKANLSEFLRWQARRMAREDERERRAKAEREECERRVQVELERRAAADPPEFVMAQCGFVHRRLRKLIECVIAQEHGMPAADTAQAMVARWREYQRDAQWLRWQCGPQKFFAQGYWRPEAAWPVDQQRVRVAMEGRVGTA